MYIIVIFFGPLCFIFSTIVHIHTESSIPHSAEPAPIAEVPIETPFLISYFEVWWMENPVYDLMVGNNRDVKPTGQPNPDWQVTNVEIRQHKLDKSKRYPQG